MSTWCSALQQDKKGQERQVLLVAQNPVEVLNSNTLYKDNTVTYV